MKLSNKPFFDRIPFALFALICFWAMGQFVMARFVLYHAQYRVLDPAHYTVAVVPLSAKPDEAAQSPDGFRKSEDGACLVKVTTLGTAHDIHRITMDLVPFFLFGAAGLGAVIHSQRKRKTGKS